MPDLVKILQRLLENQVEFVLIGGFAAVVHGSSLVTQDLDICFLFNEANLSRLLKALRDLHPRHRSFKKTKALEKEASKLLRYKNLYLETDWGRLDLLKETGGLGSYKILLSHTIQINLLGHPCKVLNIEALIQAKEFMKRPKDKETILQLRAIQEKIKKSSSSP